MNLLWMNVSQKDLYPMLNKLFLCVAYLIDVYIVLILYKNATQILTPE